MSVTSSTLQNAKRLSAASAAKRDIVLSQLSTGKMAEWADQNVVRLLNLPPNKVTNRVTAIIELCRAVSELLEHIKFSPAVDRKALQVRLNLILEDLNARIAKYKSNPVVRAYFGASSHFSVIHQFNVTTDEAAFENRAVQWIMEHIDAVHRIRRCHYLQCRAWFFAVTEHQKYCGRACGRRDAEQGESFKEKRRIYMRNRRKNDKALDARALKLARGQ
jgi:hypothetical protein